MPATPLNLTYEPLTDSFIWFASKDAFNAWVGAITITVTSASMPAATTAAQGAVKMATLPGYVPEVVNLTYLSIITEEGATEVPSKQAMIDMKTKLDNAAAKLDALMDALVTSGSLTLT